MSFWDTPRGMLLIAIAAAVIGSVVGWMAGTAPPRQIVVHVEGPLVKGP